MGERLAQRQVTVHRQREDNPHRAGVSGVGERVRVRIEEHVVAGRDHVAVEKRRQAVEQKRVAEESRLPERKRHL